MVYSTMPGLLQQPVLHTTPCISVCYVTELRVGSDGGNVCEKLVANLVITSFAGVCSA